MSSELVQGIEIAYGERTDLIVFALTGRTGSGCSTAADVLCKILDDIHVSESDFDNPERRKLAIIKDFARVQWQPFKKITVSAVIFTFLIQEDWKAIEALLTATKVSPTIRQRLEGLYRQIRTDPRGENVFEVLRAEHEVLSPEAWSFFSNRLEDAAREFRRELGNRFAATFQKLGDNLRLSGSATDDSVRPEKLFTLMRRVDLPPKSWTRC